MEPELTQKAVDEQTLGSLLDVTDSKAIVDIWCTRDSREDRKQLFQWIEMARALPRPREGPEEILVWKDDREDEDKYGPYFHVRGLFALDDKEYSLSFIPWGQVLAANVGAESLRECGGSVPLLLAHVFDDVTFYGFSQEQVTELGEALFAKGDALAQNIKDPAWVAQNTVPLGVDQEKEESVPRVD